MGYIRDIKQYWPKGSPLPADGIFFFYSPQHDTEFKVLPEQLGAPAGQGGGPTQISSEDLTDATPAGVAMFTAASAEAQLQLLDKFIADDNGIHPAFTTAYGQAGALDWLLEKVTALSLAANPAAPDAPTAGQVDDQGDTFSFLANPTYPSFASYLVAGLPGVNGPVYLDGTNSYVQGGRIYIKVVGAVARHGLAVYVAGSGNIPAGKVLQNEEAFTGSGTTPTPNEGLANFQAIGSDGVSNFTAIGS